MSVRAGVGEGSVGVKMWVRVGVGESGVGVRVWVRVGWVLRCG